LATTEAFAALLVTEGLLALGDQHPDLVIDLLGGNRPLDIARGEADIALRLAAVHLCSRRQAPRIADCWSPPSENVNCSLVLITRSATQPARRRMPTLQA